MESMTLWDGFKANIKREYEENPFNFLSQRTFRLCLCPYQKDIAVNYYKEMGNDWLPSVVEHNFGNPTISHMNKTSVTIQQMYYMYLMNKHWGKSSFNTILEIGGGYGNACRIYKSQGHTGTYTIADFKELHKVQRAYLGRTSNTTNVNMKSLQDCWGTTDLLQATFSMNEMPLSDRVHIENNITNYDYIFIAHNRVYEGIDNIEYFKNIAEKLKEKYTVNHFPCHIYNKAWFLIASRK
tara:strand:- start:5170 stop:5886 length:717 start_codon:yes stop_codon:yes gene_type:complete